MKKVLIRGPGGREKLELVEVESPPVGAAEVKIAVKASGVNFADVIVRMGLYKSAKEFVGWPITPGFEVAGEVLEVGDEVEGIAVGDRVFAVTLFNGYATEVVAPANQVFPIPEGWTEAEAATLPAVYLTAAYALYELGAPREGQDMLVHSAAGGVGSRLCELGKLAGCRVIGVVGRAHKKETALAAGADEVIVKSEEDLWKRAEELAPQGYQLVFDANGVETLQQSYDHLRPPGRLVIYGFHTMFERGGNKPNWFKLAINWLKTPRFNPLDMTSDNRSVLAFNLSYLFEETWLLTEWMGKAQSWIAEGKLAKPVVQTFPLEQVAEAHAAIESGNTVGKLALVVE